MKLGILLGYKGAPGGPDMDLILEAERLGYDSVWTSEAWGSDAVTPAAWVLAQTTKIKVGTAAPKNNKKAGWFLPFSLLPEMVASSSRTSLVFLMP